MWKKALIVQKNAGFLDQDKSQFLVIKMPKKTKATIQPFFQTIVANKRFFVWSRKHFFLAGLKQQIPSGRDVRPIWPTWFANQNRGFTSSFPLKGEKEKFVVYHSSV